MSDRIAALMNEVIAFTSMPLKDLKLASTGFSNPRSHSGLAPSDIRELALDILRRGVLVPLLVTEDGLVIAGSRRHRALELLLRWRDDISFVEELQGPLTAPRIADIEDRVQFIVADVPVAIVSSAVGDREGLERLEGIAIADNVLRVELSSYEIAARLTVLHGRGATGAQIARLIGKSASYVSRKLSTWRHAGPELRAAWRDGVMAEDGVISLSALPAEEQARVLSGPVPRGRRGPAHRPSVDMVRDFLQALEQKVVDTTKWTAAERVTEHAYRAGVLDALRWATGGQTNSAFVKLAERVAE